MGNEAETNVVDSQADAVVSLGLLGALPPEILEDVLGYLDRGSLATLSRASSALYVATLPHLYRKLELSDGTWPSLRGVGGRIGTLAAGPATFVNTVHVGKHDAHQCGAWMGSEATALGQARRPVAGLAPALVSVLARPHGDYSVCPLRAATLVVRGVPLLFGTTPPPRMAPPPRPRALRAIAVFPPDVAVVGTNFKYEVPATGRRGAISRMPDAAAIAWVWAARETAWRPYPRPRVEPPSSRPTSPMPPEGPDTAAAEADGYICRTWVGRLFSPETMYSLAASPRLHEVVLVNLAVLDPVAVLPGVEGAGHAGGEGERQREKEVYDAVTGFLSRAAMASRGVWTFDSAPWTGWPQDVPPGPPPPQPTTAAGAAAAAANEKPRRGPLRVRIAALDEFVRAADVPPQEVDSWFG